MNPYYIKQIKLLHNSQIVQISTAVEYLHELDFHINKLQFYRHVHVIQHTVSYSVWPDI